MSAEPRVLYIASRAHSGSTLLELLLTTHSAIVGVGEAKMFARDPDKRCTCGAPNWPACPFWSAVDERMRADGGEGLGAHIESEDRARFAAFNRRFFAAVSEVSGCPFVVDSSKDATRLQALLDSELDLFTFHLLRDARGVANSNMTRGSRLGRECRFYVREHLAMSYALRDQPHLEVLYEDLARHPEKEVARLLAPIGLELEPGQLGGWKAHERHNFGGNHMRFESSDEIRLDEKWRTGLTPWQQLVVRARTFPARFRKGPALSLAHRMFVPTAQSPR